MNRIFAFPIRYPVLALVLLAVFTLFFAYKIPDVEIQTNSWDFLGPTTGERLYYNEIAEKFGAEDGVLIAMVSDDGIFDRETLEKISRLTEAIAIHLIENLIVSPPWELGGPSGPRRALQQVRCQAVGGCGFVEFQVVTATAGPAPTGSALGIPRSSLGPPSDI